METRAGDPGAFAQFDLERVDSPAFVVDAARLRANLRVLAAVRDAAGIKMLSALKAFSMWKVAPIIGEYLDGVCTSGLWEARLAGEFYVGEIATYCAAYKAEDLPGSNSALVVSDLDRPLAGLLALDERRAFRRFRHIALDGDRDDLFADHADQLAGRLVGD